MLNFAPGQFSNWLSLPSLCNSLQYREALRRNCKIFNVQNFPSFCLRKLLTVYRSSSLTFVRQYRTNLAWLKWLGKKSMQLQAVTFKIDRNNITSFFVRTRRFRFLVWMTWSMMWEMWLDSLTGCCPPGFSETEGVLLSNLKLLLR